MKSSREILAVKNLGFSYKNSEAPALSGVNLNFETGKIYAILGQNGSGKSTLLKCISNFLKDYKGCIELNDESQKIDISNQKSNERAKYISLVPQQTIGNELNVYDTIMLGRKPYINISPLMVDHEITSKMLELFKLGKFSLKSTNELSGGELQTVSIARAFAQNTPILLMDEPTNNLDIKKQHELFDILNTQVKTRDLCVICVLHDVNQAMKYANKFIFMKDGKVYANGNKNIINAKLLKEIYGVQAKILQNKYIVI